MTTQRMSTSVWSESAFGVVHKSYKKMAPKLAAARKTMPQFMSRQDTMTDRTARNYAVMRTKAGQVSETIKLDQKLGRGGPGLKPYRIKRAKDLKDMANASVVAHSNVSRREGQRFLP